MSPVRRLSTQAELLEATGGHPVAALDVGAGFRGPAYAVGSPPGATVAFSRRSDHGVPGSAVLGSARGLAVLLDDREVRAWVTGEGKRHLSVPRGCVGAVAERLELGTRGGDWDWLWTRDAPPAVHGEEHVRSLDPATRPEMVRFLDEHSPRTHGQPFARPQQHWVGVHDPEGRLVAIGCSEPSEGGTPTLAGIAVATDRRGEGWGAAVTAHLTRLAVEATGACALGMFADNDTARRLYHRLGFRTGMQWTSRWFG